VHVQYGTVKAGPIRHMYNNVQRRVGLNQAYVQVRSCVGLNCRHMYKYVQRCVGLNQASCTSTFKDVSVQIRHMYKYVQSRVSSKMGKSSICENFASKKCRQNFAFWVGQNIRHMYRTLKFSWSKAQNNCVMY